MIRQSKYEIYVSAIFTKLIDSKSLQNSELIKQLKDQNKEIELKIIKLKIFERKLENNARKFSLIIFVSQLNIINRSIKHDIYYNYE